MSWLRRRPTAVQQVSSGRRTFAAGVLSGVALVLAVVFIVNNTTIPDLLISPLLRPDTNGKADAIVVMGAGVVAECVPNQNAVRRVLLGARMWREGRAPIMVFTGGSDQRSCPVAVAMARMAQDIGVPASVVHIETTSLTTRENGEHTAPLLRKLGVRRVLVVTDRLHMRRSAGTFARLGFEIERASVPIYEGHPDNVSMLMAGTREFAAVTYYRSRGWIEGQAAAAHADAREAVSGTFGKVQSGSAMQSSSDQRPGSLVVLGASYAGGWDLNAVGPTPVIVRGAPGEQSFEMLARFERDVVAARPRAVLIWGFINDISRSGLQNMDAVTARIRDSYTQMIALARKHGIEPILATEVTLRQKAGFTETLASWAGWLMGKTSYQDRVNEHVMANNRWLMELAKRENLLILDFQAALAENGVGRRREFAKEDGSHIPPAGYAALTAYATPILQNHLRGRAASDSPR